MHDNEGMDTVGTTRGLPPDVEADAQTIIEQALSGNPIDPEAARRVHERASKFAGKFKKSTAFSTSPSI